MPAEDYFCPDNFFKKMTDLESPKKNNDCYFYYYSTCAKGDSCQFRHEPAALGCETMCSFWKEGKCLNIHCNFRHMELRKNRKAIPCYWESQPKGCLKAHCPFMHQHPRPFDNGSDKLDEISRPDSVFKDQSERRVTAVDSLVVNFEEESDNESIPSYSPLRNPNRIVRVKTLEEIRLEKIQAESAAFYSYHDEDLMTPEDADDLRQRLVPRISTRLDRRFSAPPNFRNSTISKIRANKRLSEDELANILGDDSLRKKSKIVVDGDEGNLKVIVNSRPTTSQVSVTVDERQKKRLVKPSVEKCESTSNIRVKTLAELRAERNMRVQSEVEQQEDVVTSTSVEDRIQKTSPSAPKRKIKLRRKPVPRKDLTEFEHTESTVTKLSDNEDMLLTNNSDTGSNVDESMLLSDDDDLDSMALGAEDELLNEVEDF